MHNPLPVLNINTALYSERMQGRRKHLKLGGAQHFEGTFFLRKGALSKNKKGTSLFISKSLGVHAPSAPLVPAYITVARACKSEAPGYLGPACKYEVSWEYSNTFGYCLNGLPN